MEDRALSFSAARSSSIRKVTAIALIVSEKVCHGWQFLIVASPGSRVLFFEVGCLINTSFASIKWGKQLQFLLRVAKRGHPQAGILRPAHLAMTQGKLHTPRLLGDFTAMELRLINYPAAKTNHSPALRTEPLLLGAGLRSWNNRGYVRSGLEVSWQSCPGPACSVAARIPPCLGQAQATAMLSCPFLTTKKNSFSTSSVWALQEAWALPRSSPSWELSPACKNFQFTWTQQSLRCDQPFFSSWVHSVCGVHSGKLRGAHPYKASKPGADDWEAATHRLSHPSRLLRLEWGWALLHPSSIKLQRVNCDRNRDSELLVFTFQYKRQDWGCKAVQLISQNTGPGSSPTLQHCTGVTALKSSWGSALQAEQNGWFIPVVPHSVLSAGLLSEAGKFITRSKV